MSDRYIRSDKGKRKWYRVALGATAALPYSEIESQMEERIRWALEELKEWAADDPSVDAEGELATTTIVKLNDLADAFGATPQIFRNELKKLGIIPSIAACELEQHAGKRCDCTGTRILTVAEVRILLPYGRGIYYRMVRRPGRVKIVTKGKAE